jgi:hypothetical protein
MTWRGRRQGTAASLGRRRGTAASLGRHRGTAASFGRRRGTAASAESAFLIIILQTQRRTKIICKDF